jgi:hypothetical protein
MDSPQVCGIQPPLAGDDGLTLVEVLLAIVVLVVAILGMLGAFDSAPAQPVQRRSDRDAPTRAAGNRALAGGPCAELAMAWRCWRRLRPRLAGRAAWG